MMRREKFAIANIYVPVKRRATLKPETVQEIAQSILEIGQQTPILVRRDGDRFVLDMGCIASKRARHWAKRRSPDTSPRPRSTNRPNLRTKGAAVVGDARTRPTVTD
jgi:hypothetical protein